jgi:hypothetical protein
MTEDVIKIFANKIGNDIIDNSIYLEWVFVYKEFRG